jgi:hypothetical protein
VRHFLRLAGLSILFIALGVLAVTPGGDPDRPAREARPVEPIQFDATKLPPRSFPEAVAERPVPAWLRTNLRIGHLPPGLGRMPEAYLAAGYNVLTINALRKWDVVGPTASLYDAAEVKEADEYLRRYVKMVHKDGAKACRWAADDAPPPVEVAGPLILATTFRRQPKEGRTVVHLLNAGSSWGQHSIYQKLAPLPEELRKEFGYPDSPELRGTWPIREEVIPLHDIRVTCRMPGVKKATLQPGDQDLPLRRVDGGRCTGCGSSPPSAPTTPPASATPSTPPAAGSAKSASRPSFGATP